ncbi:MAG: hypothetical protein LAP61_08370 [Acidobacteriia bacterium]|nr:hypothetical protein [Terriglobia bacterium]
MAAVAEPVVAKPVVAQPVAPPIAAPPVAAKPVEEQLDPDPRTVLQREVILPPDAVLQPKAFTGSKPPVMLDAIPAEARPVIMPDVPLGASPVELPDPLLEPVSNGLPHAETFADRLADLAELLHGERVPYTAPRLFQESAAPGPRMENRAQAGEKTPVIVDVTFHEDVTPDGKPTQQLLAAPPSLLLLAEPQPPSVAKDIPIEAFQPKPASSTVRTQQTAAVEPSAPAAVILPDPPNRGVAPALASLQDYTETAERLMHPADCDTPTACAKALPTVTLPGPALPRELMSLQAAGLVPIGKGGRRGAALPSSNGWVLKSVVVGILLTAGLATYSMMPGTSSTSAPPKPTPEPAPDPPVSARSVRSTNSLARFVEVTGVRFMEVNKKPQIHYLVVNHSSAPLNSMTVYVTLRAATGKPGQAPIARITFRSPALAAFEAKEMFSSIERATAQVDLPDWQDLRADVEVQ